KKQLGDGTRYKEIYELNRDRIKNPSLIYPGQTLSLPGGG
ncbi:MAG: LysM peptidoglycan-binding domain-containing protein, partial [Clostridia bacterium]|nr:LysM peptidoglycan-binding domain-containing protein [Clostridia bacterium]